MSFKRNTVGFDRLILQQGMVTLFRLFSFVISLLFFKHISWKCVKLVYIDITHKRDEVKETYSPWHPFPSHSCSSSTYVTPVLYATLQQCQNNAKNSFSDTLFSGFKSCLLVGRKCQTVPQLEKNVFFFFFYTRTNQMMLTGDSFISHFDNYIPLVIISSYHVLYLWIT